MHSSQRCWLWWSGVDDVIAPMWRNTHAFRMQNSTCYYGCIWHTMDARMKRSMNILRMHGSNIDELRCNAQFVCILFVRAWGIRSYVMDVMNLKTELLMRSFALCMYLMSAKNVYFSARKSFSDKILFSRFLILQPSVLRCEKMEHSVHLENLTQHNTINGLLWQHSVCRFGN